MKLNHINLTVNDVQEASDFLVKYFGMRSMGGNKGMGFLTDEQEEWGFVLTLMKATEGTQSKYPGTFHIGFFIDSKETVDNPSTVEPRWFRYTRARGYRSFLWLLCERAWWIYGRSRGLTQ